MCIRDRSHAQARQLVPDGLIYHQRRSDLPRDLQSAEATRHLLVTTRGEDAVAKLGESDDADGNLVGEGAERSLLLARDEDRGIQNRLHGNRPLPQSWSVVSGNAWSSSAARPTSACAPMISSRAREPAVHEGVSSIGTRSATSCPETVTRSCSPADTRRRTAETSLRSSRWGIRFTDA